MGPVNVAVFNDAQSNLIILLVAVVMGSVAALMGAQLDRAARRACGGGHGHNPGSRGAAAVRHRPFGRQRRRNSLDRSATAQGAFAKKLDLLKDGRRIVLTAMERSE